MKRLRLLLIALLLTSAALAQMRHLITTKYSIIRNQLASVFAKIRNKIGLQLQTGLVNSY